jgi:hypothetical protein
MNSLMARSWAALGRSNEATNLHRALAELAASPIIELQGATVLKQLVSPGLGEPSAQDPTGFEATTNKIHISDYVESSCEGDALVVQGVKFAEALAQRLGQAGGSFRVIMSRDPSSGEVNVRFFARRAGQPWGSDNLEDYQTEEMAQWDT